MKARTEVLLAAAEAALKGACSVVLYGNSEGSVWNEMCDADTERDFLKSDGEPLRCLYLCFLAAACETGDL